MIVLTLYVAISSNPPVSEALVRTFVPQQFDAYAIVTLIGGTVGGYISFAGAHRLLDAGIKGQQHIPHVNRSAVTGVVVTAVMRTILFLAALGVVAAGSTLDKDNPAASVFKIAAGNIGYQFFGIVIWSAGITSVVGAAYTSISFVRSFHPWFDKYHRYLAGILVLLSTAVFVAIGRPVEVLVMAGTFNGLILPISLVVILVAAKNRSLMGKYHHPIWMQLMGWVVVAIMSWLGIVSIQAWMTK
jgi:Mn2+/Fe2+ NRAMP family transporter